MYDRYLDYDDSFSGIYIYQNLYEIIYIIVYYVNYTLLKLLLQILIRFCLGTFFNPFIYFLCVELMEKSNVN
jgi:hypothetical protein